MSDDEQSIAEITRTQRVIVYADVAKVCADNAADRAKFEGTNFEYVREWVRAEAWDFLHDTSADDGFRVEEDYDEVDVDAYTEQIAT